MIKKYFFKSLIFVICLSLVILILDENSNAEMFEVIKTIQVGSNPRWVEITPDGSKAYVVNEGSDVSVIDTALNEVIHTIPANHPGYMLINPFGTYGYINNASGNNVTVVNISDDTVVKQIPVGMYPTGMTITPNASKLYVSNFYSKNISVIDTLSNTELYTISLVAEPTNGISISEDGSKVYVLLESSRDAVAVIDTATDSVKSYITVGDSGGNASMAVCGSKLYVVNNSSDDISVINTNTDQIIATVPVGSYPVEISLLPDCSKAYVSNLYSSNVSVIDTASFDVVNIFVGSNPAPIEVAPCGSVVFVANSSYPNATNVKIIDTSSDTVIAPPVPVGVTPTDIKFTPNGLYAYVANGNSSSVTVIQTVDDSDGDGVVFCFDLCPDEDATGFDTNSDGCLDNIAGLVGTLETLVQEGVIAEELQNSLLSKVENAEKSASKDNICAAINQLEALKNQVNAQRGHKISDEAADEIIAYTDSVIAYLLYQLPPGETC